MAFLLVFMRFLFLLTAAGLALTLMSAPLVLLTLGVRQYRWWSTEGPGARLRERLVERPASEAV